MNLRGSHSLTTYLADNENLQFDFTIQNSNRNEGKENIIFRVYRGSELLKTINLKDNGTGLGDGKPSPVREVPVFLEQPGQGTYRIEISTTGDDQFIRSFTTTQKHYQFKNRLYLAGSKEYHVLGRVEEAPITVYVKGTSLSARTSHEKALQTVTVNGKKLTVTKTQTPASMNLPNNTDFFAVTVPIRDIVLETDGVIALSSSAEFSIPTRGVETLHGSSDPSQYDYVLTKFVNAGREGSWLIASQTVTGSFSKNTHFTISSDPPIGTNGKPFRVRELEITIKANPMNFQDVKKGIKQLLGMKK
jgi:hypothetical protein